MRRSLRWLGLVVVNFTLLVLAFGSPSLLAASRGHVRRIYTIPVHPEARASVLEDVSRLGVLLLNPHAWLVQGEHVVTDPRLLLWDIQGRKLISEVALPAWAQWQERVPRLLGESDIFRFENDEARVVALQTPWLVLIDVDKRAEIRRVLPSDDYVRPDSPGRPSSESGAPRVACMAISPQDGSIATAFNVRGDTHVYLYDSELDKQLAIWTLPRYVQDLAWSRNGKQLAVLFNGRFDGKRRDLGRGFVAPVHEPDVWIVDPYSGVASVKFWTGSNQSRVKYSRDSGLLYVINDFYYVYPGQRGAITVFSSAMGERIRTISGGPRGVHSNFSLSADGRLIAADASTEVPQRLHLEPIYGAKIARVVLLDARTGELLFEYHEKTDRDTSDPLPLAFSEDGRFLFVDFPLSREKPYEHIEVFSLTESK